MSDPAPRAVFFDIGGTLGDARLSGPPYRLERLEVFPYVPAVLDDLRRAGARLGLISNIGEVTPESVAAVESALEAAGLATSFDRALRIYGVKDSVAVFERALAAAGLAEAPDRAVFVGEDARERDFARKARMRAAPHPLLARAVLEGEPLSYVRIDAPASLADRPWRRALLDQGVVPLHVTGEGGTVVYAIAPRSALPPVMNMRFVVQTLGADDDPVATDLYLLRDDLAVRSGALSATGQAAALVADARTARWVLSSSLEGLYVAVPGSESIDGLHFPVARHGHHLKLAADVALLQPFGPGPNARAAAFAAPAAALAERELSTREVSGLAAITPERLGEHVARYSGATPLGDDGDGAVRTRHSLSPDNRRVTDMLIRDLERIGGGAFRVRARPFSFQGRVLHNVEAEWAGTVPELPELVVMSAHLDSTAANSHVDPGTPPYRPASDPAPGADDDASGVAAVLAAAEALRALGGDGAPRRTIRFVLFNAEEQGLVGSRAYARAQAAAAAPIAAVFQMDMIGNDSVAPPLFELHAGYSPDADTEARSLELAGRMGRLRPVVSPGLDEPELCFTKGSDPDQRDGAEGRSDHASFQERGYAACCASEDLFVNAPPLPPAEENEHYHRETDVAINRRYAADIARVVAAAVWLTANP
jgi:bacterial leucyl aminopeptidase